MDEKVDKTETPKQLKFVDNEKILCYQGALLYEAKCLKSELKADGNYMHLVHYAGWNKHYDEWVSEGRCMKYTIANLQKQNDILEKVSKDRSKRIKLGNGVKLKNERSQSNQLKSNSESNNSAVSTIVSGNEEPTLVAEKQGLETITEKKINLSVKHQQLAKQQLQDRPITIPHVLKSLLGDDWVFVNNERMIFNLPAQFTVEQAISMYMDEAQKSFREDEWKVIKLDLNAMKEWFNVSLGSKLLYKFERPQLGDMIDLYPELPPCQIYGIPHFMRFFTQIEASMNKYSMKDQDRKLVRINCQNIINFISDNLSILFSPDDYFHAPAEYHRRAMT